MSCGYNLQLINGWVGVGCLSTQILPLVIIGLFVGIDIYLIVLDWFCTHVKLFVGNQVKSLHLKSTMGTPVRLY
jgi:hypothetical protein